VGVEFPFFFSRSPPIPRTMPRMDFESFFFLQGPSKQRPSTRRVIEGFSLSLSVGRMFFFSLSLLRFLPYLLLEQGSRSLALGPAFPFPSPPFLFPPPPSSICVGKKARGRGFRR